MRVLPHKFARLFWFGIVRLAHPSGGHEEQTHPGMTGLLLVVDEGSQGEVVRADGDPDLLLGFSGCGPVRGLALFQVSGGPEGMCSIPSAYPMP